MRPLLHRGTHWYFVKISDSLHENEASQKAVKIFCSIYDPDIAMLECYVEFLFFLRNPSDRSELISHHHDRKSYAMQHGSAIYLLVSSTCCCCKLWWIKSSGEFALLNLLIISIWFLIPENHRDFKWCFDSTSIRPQQYCTTK